mgnify:CR=1 FL=1
MIITITNITLKAYHGVFPFERENGNIFRVSVRALLPDTMGTKTDMLEDTVNYQDIYDIVTREMSIPSALLEHVAARIGKAIKHNIPLIEQVEVTVEKHAPSLGGDVEWVGVTVTV